MRTYLLSLLCPSNSSISLMSNLNSRCKPTHTLLSSLTLCSLATHNLVDNSMSLSSSRARMSYLPTTRLPCLEQLIISMVVKICSMMITLGSVLKSKWMVLITTMNMMMKRMSRCNWPSYRMESTMRTRRGVSAALMDVDELVALCTATHTRLISVVLLSTAMQIRVLRTTVSNTLSTHPKWLVLPTSFLVTPCSLKTDRLVQTLLPIRVFVSRPLSLLKLNSGERLVVADIAACLAILSLMTAR